MKAISLGNLIKLLALSAVAFEANASIVIGPVLNPANGHVYYLLSQNNWTGSEAEAVTLGGHLTTINDQAENDWVYSTFSSYAGVSRNLWIGLSDKDNEGTFVWASGESSSFLNWFSGEPNNFNDEDYVHMFSPYWNRAGAWNDYQDLGSFFENSTGMNNMFGVVEVVPEPSTYVAGALLLLPFGASILRKMRKERTA